MWYFPNARIHNCTQSASHACRQQLAIDLFMLNKIARAMLSFSIFILWIEQWHEVTKKKLHSKPATLYYCVIVPQTNIDLTYDLKLFWSLLKFECKHCCTVEWVSRLQWCRHFRWITIRTCFNSRGKKKINCTCIKSTFHTTATIYQWFFLRPI